MSVRTYGSIYRISVLEKLAYRWNIISSASLKFLGLISQMILWAAATGTVTDGKIAGYSMSALAGYYYLTFVARSFSSMAGMDRQIVREIRDGTLNAFLVRPLSYVGFHFTHRVAHKSVFFLMASIPYITVFFLLDWLYDLQMATHQVPLAILSLGLGFVMGFLIMFLVGCGSFWLLEASSFAFVILMIEYFLSGHMFPLDMLPPSLQALALSLPFAYETYFPIAIFLGKIQGAALYQGLLIQIGWVVMLFLLVQIVYRRGLLRYTAAGG